MADARDVIRKRSFYPVPFNGDTIHVRAMRESELKVLSEFYDAPESFGFAIGKSLLNEDGTNCYTEEESESPQEFGKRVLADLDLQSDIKSRLMAVIQKVSSGVTDFEALKKN